MIEKRVPDHGEWVNVYYNFHKDCLSVRNTEGIVILHTDEVVLKDAEFKVSEKGRQRVIEEECKNIHAKVFGHWVPEKEVDFQGDTLVRYNPYEFKHFVFADTEEPIHTADFIRINKTKMYV